MQQGIGNLAQRPEFGLGDFVSDVFKPVRNVVNKVVPRELQPILPVVASAFLGPAVGGMFSSLGPAAAGFLGAGTTSALTQALTGSGQIDPTSTLLSAGIGGIQGARIPNRFTDSSITPVKKPDMSASFDQRPAFQGSGLTEAGATSFQAPITLTPGTEAYEAAMKEAGFFDRALMKAKEYTGSFSIDPESAEFGDRASKFKFDRGPDSILKAATAFSLPYTAKAEAEEAIDLEKAEGLANMELEDRKRKDKKIYIDFVMRAGFTREEAERMAEGAGYDEGGKVMLAMSDPDPMAERMDMLENLALDMYKRPLEELKPKEIELLEGMIEEMDFGFAKGGRIKASNGLGVLMDIFNAGNQRIETGDIDARFRPLPEIDEDTVSEDEKRIALLEDEIRYLMEGGTLEANRDLIEKYAAELKMLKEKQDPSLRTRRSEGGKVPGLPAGKQVDAREGMFIPMGGAKRADDVPAMLSVNEFVLNDNAVAGLGKMLTGPPDPRAGARALYKIQDQLEAMVV